jgi:hypothetical protein
LLLFRSQSYGVGCLFQLRSLWTMKAWYTQEE